MRDVFARRETEDKEYKIVHRLDKETSGVMLFAKNEDFQKKAIAEFKANRVYKEYVAIVDGKPDILSTFDYIYEALGITE